MDNYLESVVVIIAAVILAIQNRRQNKKLGKVESNLTTTNGGTHVKDHLLNIEQRLSGQDERLSGIELMQQVLGGRMTNLDRRVSNHILQRLQEQEQEHDESEAV